MIMTLKDCENCVAKKVVKRSGKPFKSGLKTATIRSVVDHPYLPGELAFIFEEDESCVSICQCKFIGQ